MRRIAAIARKELRQLGRDPLSLIMLLGLPAFMLALYGYALNFDVRHVALAVQDRDYTPESRELIAALRRRLTRGEPNHDQRREQGCQATTHLAYHRTVAA